MADKEKKKRGFYREYLNDYKPSSNGGYVYTGRVYEFSGSAGEKRRFLTLTILLTALSAAFTIAPECLEPTDMSRSFITLIPWMMSLIAIIVLGWAVFRLVWRFNDLKEYVFNKTVQRIPRAAVAAGVLALAAMLSQIIYIIIFGLSDKPAATLLRPIFAALCAASCFILSPVFKRAVFKEKL